MEVKRKVFHDAVHGAISLHPLCVKIIDTPQFQRLRHVKQLGGVYSVYPAASNNRFEHSIGVCHLAGELARALQSRQSELQIDDKDVLCVEIAALCHDLGHGPFSHLWEDFMKKAGEDWAHEDQSVRMFDHLMEHLKNGDKLEGDECYNSLEKNDFDFVKEMINGIKIIGNEWNFKGRGKEKAFLYEIVANKRTGVDVDKWDYFLRDGHALGIKVTFDYYRLIKFCRVETHDEITEIVFRDKEISGLYDMYHARAVLHHKAYKHRVVKTIETMLVDAFLKTFKCTATICKHTKKCKDERKCTHPGKHKSCIIHVYLDPAAYTIVTDDVFYQILRMEAEDKDDKDLKEAKQILENIMNRDLYRFIGSVSVSEAELEHMTKEKSKDTKKRLREMEEDFSEELMKHQPNQPNQPKRSKLCKDDLTILTIKQDYGMENENPISKIKFYSKDGEPARESRAKAYPGLLEPKRFLEVNLAVLCKNYDETIRKDAKTAYDEMIKSVKKPNWIASDSDTQGTS